MNNIRIENDVKIKWTILNKDGSTCNLSNMANLKVGIYPSRFATFRYFPEVTISGHNLAFVFPSEKQLKLGPYDIRLEYNEPDNRLESGYSKVVMDKMEAFCLVPFSRQSTLLLQGDDELNFISLKQVRPNTNEGGDGIYWGNILGDIEKQEDLNDLISKSIKPPITLVADEAAYDAIPDKDPNTIYGW